MSKIEIKEVEMLEEYPDILNVMQLRTVLNIGKNTAYKLLNENVIKSIRIGKKFRIPKLEVIKFILNQK